MVIPKEPRDRLGIHPGDEVTFRLLDGGVLVERVPAPRDLRGALRGAGLLPTLEVEHAGEIRRGR